MTTISTFTLFGLFSVGNLYHLFSFTRIAFFGLRDDSVVENFFIAWWHDFKSLLAWWRDQGSQLAYASPPFNFFITLVQAWVSAWWVIWRKYWSSYVIWAMLIEKSVISELWWLSWSLWWRDEGGTIEEPL